MPNEIKKKVRTRDTATAAGIRSSEDVAYNGYSREYDRLLQQQVSINTSASRLYGTQQLRMGWSFSDSLPKKKLKNKHQW